MKHKELLKRVAAVCREARETRGITQEDIALEMGYCGGNYISHFEKGEVNSLTTFLRYLLFMSDKETWTVINEVYHYFKEIEEENVKNVPFF